MTSSAGHMKVMLDLVVSAVVRSMKASTERSVRVHGLGLRLKRHQ